MPPRTRLVPCARCRERHLKCDPEHPCTNCRTVQVSCEKSRQKKIRFKHVFAHNRSISTPGTGGKEREQVISPTSVPRTTSVSSTPSIGRTQTLDLSETFDVHDARSTFLSHHPGIDSGTNDVGQDQHGPRCPDIESHLGPHRGTDANSDIGIRRFGSMSSPIVGSSPNRIEQNEPSYQSSPQAVPQGLRIEESCKSPIQNACMIRCFVERLASAFDVTDPNRHYEDIVPLRAANNPLLLYAICTASARYLYQLHSQSNLPGVIEYNGVKLPNLSEKSSLLYHNICISYLRGIANDPTALQSGEVLAAITILRFHEQVDTHFTKLDQEIYTRAFQIVFKAQDGDRVEPVTAMQTQFGRGNESVAEHSLKFYASVVALRQEICSVLYYRRPFRLPIATQDLTKNFESQSLITMYQWAGYCVEWCAQVLKFCFADDDEIDSGLDEASRIRRWASLWSFVGMWNQKTPDCFRPIYSESRNPNGGRYFPQMWHTHGCQVLALQHLEFGKIALVAHNPSLQRIGFGARAEQRAQERVFLEFTRMICGLAISNPTSQPAMVSAAVSIAMSGEYFKDPGEQHAILKLLETLQQEHAWHAAPLAQTLRTSWELEDANEICS